MSIAFLKLFFIFEDFFNYTLNKTPKERQQQENKIKKHKNFTNSIDNKEKTEYYIYNALTGTGSENELQRAVGRCETVFVSFATSPLSIPPKGKPSRTVRNPALKEGVYLYIRVVDRQ